MNNDRYSNNGTLITMHNIAQPMNHLLTIQLVNQPSAPSTKTNFKPQYFYFLTLAPGAGNGSSRTYDFSNKINMKFSIAEIFGLGFTLQQVAGGNPRVLPYSKFSKSGTGTKVVSIVESAKQGKYGPTRIITIFVSCNSQKYSLNLSTAEAYALAKQLDLSATEATKLEFNRLSSSPTIRRPHQSVQTQEPQIPMSQPFDQTPPQMPLQMPPQEQPAQITPQMPPQEQPAQMPNQPYMDQQSQPQQNPQQSNVNDVVDQFSNVLNAQVQS